MAKFSTLNIDSSGKGAVENFFSVKMDLTGLEILKMKKLISKIFLFDTIEAPIQVIIYTILAV